jgi:perosamine synthetase
MSNTTIPFSRPFIGSEEEKLIIEALQSGWISNGPFVNQLEDLIKAYTGSPYAVAVCNGTAALHLVLWGIGIRPGDEVIVPSFGFIAAASISNLLGAKVIGVDACPKTWCIDPEAVKKSITPYTKAIIVIHTYGNIANMKDLLEISVGHGIPLIEDAAEAFGSKYKERYAGTMGQAGIFSFHASKTLTTGEGGMVLTSDGNLYERMIALREHGMKERKKYWHEYAGHNFRLSNLQAALGCAQFAKLPQIVAGRKKIHKIYLSLIKEHKLFTPQYFQEEIDPVIWSFAIMLETRETGITLRKKRDRIIELLENERVELRPGFYPLNELPPFQKTVKKCAISSWLSQRIIALPTYLEMTERDLEFIVQRLTYQARSILG